MNCDLCIPSPIHFQFEFKVKPDAEHFDSSVRKLLTTQHLSRLILGPSDLSTDFANLGTVRYKNRNIVGIDRVSGRDGSKILSRSGFAFNLRRRIRKGESEQFRRMEGNITKGSDFTPFISISAPGVANRSRTKRRTYVQKLAALRKDSRNRLSTLSNSLARFKLIGAVSLSTCSMIKRTT